MKTPQAVFVKRWMPLKYRARNLALLIYNKDTTKNSVYGKVLADSSKRAQNQGARKKRPRARRPISTPTRHNNISAS